MHYPADTARYERTEKRGAILKAIRQKQAGRRLALLAGAVLAASGAPASAEYRQETAQVPGAGPLVDHLDFLIAEVEARPDMTMAELAERLLSERGLGLAVKAAVPGRVQWGTQTFIAGLRHDALTAPWVIPGAMDREAFNIYVETQLAPTLQPGDVVILYYVSVHKSAKAEVAIRARGAWMLFLPQYSPDLNPIEQACSKLKAHLRRIQPAPSTLSSRLSATSVASTSPTNA